MTTTHFLADLGNVAIWAGTIVPLLFFIQYTVLAKWWKNDFGRSIVALDACLFVVFFFSCVEKAAPGWSFLQTIAYQWIVTLAVCGVAIVAAYRLVVFERLRRVRRFVRPRKDIPEPGSAVQLRRTKL